MALVVESHNSNAANNLGQSGQPTSLSVTAPTGITVGDLLIAASCQYSQTNSPLPTGFTLSDYVYFEDGGAGNINETEHNIRYGYKIADSGDAAAGSFSFDGFTNGGAACVIRISGWTSGDPIYDKAGTNSDSTPLTRPYSQLLLMFAAASCSDGAPGFSYDGYSITSADSNPAWTEVMDAEFSTNIDSDTAGLVLAVAYANTADTSNITAFGATLTEGTADTIGTTSALAVLVQPTSASADVSHLSITPTIASLESTNSANAEVSHISLSPVLNAVDAQSSSDGTQWTNQDKPNTDWTNKSL